MKRVLSILPIFFMPFFATGQKIDSIQFKNLFTKVTEIYVRNIDSYLIQLAKSEVSSLPETASVEAKQIQLAAIEAKVYVKRKILKDIFSSQYPNLSNNLSRYGETPKAYLIGYLDMAIKSDFPKIEEAFYRNNWKDLAKINDQF